MSKDTLGYEEIYRDYDFIIQINIVIIDISLTFELSNFRMLEK